MAVLVNTVVFLVTYSLSYGQTPRSLDRLIEQACPKGSGFTESIMNQNLPSWEGYRSVDGLNLVLDKQMARETTADVNMACAYILRNLDISKEQIASAMMERSRNEASNEEEPWRLVYLLRQMEKMIDREKQGEEVVQFIAGFLNDRRPTEPLNRGPESVPRQQRRVCDGATSALINFMEATGLCEKYDSRFGNPGGEATWERREQVIQAVVKVLQDNDLLPEDFWNSLPPTRLPKTTSVPTNITTSLDQRTGVAETKPKTPTLSGNSPSLISWSIFAVLTVAATGFLWLLIKNRK